MILNEKVEAKVREDGKKWTMTTSGDFINSRLSRACTLDEEYLACHAPVSKTTETTIPSKLIKETLGCFTLMEIDQFLWHHKQI